MIAPETSRISLRLCLSHHGSRLLPVPLQGRTNAIDPVSAIYSLVRDWASGHKTLIVKEEEILPQVMPTHPLRAR
jgi:hypothetical protein